MTRAQRTPGSSSGRRTWFALFDEVRLLQALEKFPDIVLHKFPADAELAAISSTIAGSVEPIVEKFEDSRSDEVEVEHLALPDIEDDRAVLAVCAAHCVGDPVHLKPHLLDVWAHCDTLAWSKTRKNWNLSVKRHRGRNVTWDQQDASVVRGSAIPQFVRFSVVTLQVRIHVLINLSRSPEQ